MPEVVGVRFHGIGKAYDFELRGLDVETGDMVVVETNKGLQLGFCADNGKFREERHVFGNLLPVLRIANEVDVANYEANAQDEKEAFRICRSKIEEFKLGMSLVDAEYTLDRQKLLFYFTADDRVDFRQIVRDLAAIFRCRIELRQIGVRDEAMMSGGVGICGREFCCSSWLTDFVPVSVRMAKTQSLSMNPTKISGSCGRLMCCLKYEQDQYVETKRIAPRIGAVVRTPRGEATVLDVNLLTEAVTIRLLGDESDDIYRYQLDELDYNRPARKQQAVLAKPLEEALAGVTAGSSAEDQKESCGCGSSAEGSCPKKTQSLSNDDESSVVATSLPAPRPAKADTLPEREHSLSEPLEAIIEEAKPEAIPEARTKRRSRRIGKPAKPGFIPHMIMPEDLPEA